MTWRKKQAWALRGTAVTGAQAPREGFKDLAAMETELSEKGLPEGTTAAPVAGYLYFPLPRNKQAIYQLEYTLNGQKVLLILD
jgi:hypothetical protein